MIPYVLLMFMPLLISSFATQCRCKYVYDFDEKQRIQNKNSLLTFFFIMLTIILALRDESIGRDLKNYKYYFEKISLMTKEEIFEYDLDILYTSLNWIVSRFTDDFQVFLLVVALITIIPVAWIYSEDRDHSFLKIVLFMNMSTFIMMFSGLRQTIAISIGFIAYRCVKKQKLLLFIVFVIIAWGVHHSAFMMFFFYPLYHFSFKKKHLWFVVPIIICVFIFNKQIFMMVTNLIDSDKYTSAISSTGAYTMIILFIMFAIFSYVIPDEKMMDKETLGLRNFLLLAVLLQCFSPIHTIAMRMNYYYIIFIPILIPKIITYAKDELKEIAYFAKIILTLFFVSYYLFNTYNSCQTGISALDTYPYVPFWK